MNIMPTRDCRVPSYSDGFVSDSTRCRLQHIVAAHVDSFDYFLEHGLNEAVEDLAPMEIQLHDNLILKLQYASVRIEHPVKADDSRATSNFSLENRNALVPSEARESGSSYAGLMTAHIDVTLNDNDAPMNLQVKLGNFPIMVMSARCHLRGLSCRQLVEMREEANEVGGYFIVNGIERVIRLIQVPRRNHATAVERNSYKNRGTSYSEKGVAMRCCRRDNSSVTLTMHYLNNGGATLRFVLRKQEYLLPVILVAKCLVDLSDRELFDRIVAGDERNTFLTTRIELLLRDFKSYRCFNRKQSVSFLGSLFRSSLPITDHVSDEDAGSVLIRSYLFVHCDSFADKLECLLHMMRKLFAFVQGRCVADNSDALVNHDILLPGHLFSSMVKEKLEDVFATLRLVLKKDYRLNPTKCEAVVSSSKHLQSKIESISKSVGQKISTFLSTGNLVSTSGLDLQQATGFTIVAERLNLLRYMSHFQSVHRGQFFTTMKTTTVRKLLPESWGFLCPVHTPDGSPCGLLNHVSRESALVAFHPAQRPCHTPEGPLEYSRGLDARLLNRRSYIQDVLVSVGVVPCGVGAGDGQSVLGTEHIPVLLDGVVLGCVSSALAASVVAQLRYLKASSNNFGVGKYRGRGKMTDTVFDQLKSSRLLLDPMMEIAFIPNTASCGAYPGVYMFTQPGRMIRPVLQLGTNFVEWIGPMEQAFMEIACLSSDVRVNETTHLELHAGIMLSQVASMTPFSDYNQSPRNMYQCQMGKQTMGTPAHALKHRTDNKLYRIQNTQAPVVQTRTQLDYSMDDYPQGCNAVVAVISYTGYDMEDAMIISKASYERGFGHGCVYKTHSYDLDDEEKQQARKGGATKPSLVFSNVHRYADGRDRDSHTSGSSSSSSAALQGESINIERFCPDLDDDGLPFEGVAVQFDDPLICMVDMGTGEHRVIKHKEHEAAYVDTVRIIGASSKVKGDKASLRRVSITLRYNRNPVIGDKFSSRHGQKGTLSVLWPQESMPFSESGMSPDVLINPHAYPSRMTIGMLIESMAGKSGAMHGMFQDATPFQFHEEQKVVDYIGHQLRATGYNYCGSEPLYNGLTGEVMHADIFMGVVFYQRLRHMVSDKSQVRSTGPVTALTKQPVKGRKKHGGIRLGEMERDALLSHGVAFCLQDRLMNCSDMHVAHVCSKCGGLLSVYPRVLNQAAAAGWKGNFHGEPSKHYCSTCSSQAFVQPIQLPYVFRYLANELAGMGIKMTIKLSE